MQFRIRTLLVIVTVLACVLTLSSSSEPGRRAGLLVAILLMWLAGGLTIQSLRRLTPPLRFHRLLFVLGSVALTSIALSSVVVLTGLILQDRFQPTLGAN